MAGTSPDPDVTRGVVVEVVAQGGEAIALAETVVTGQGTGNIVDAALAAWCRVDGLVCCACKSPHMPFLSLAEDDFDAVASAGKEHGVRANVLSSIANTRMTRAAKLQFSSEPADIAPMAVYLLSNRSASVTGDLLGVYGNDISRWTDAHEHRTARHHKRLGQDDIDAVMPWLLGDSAVNMPQPDTDATAGDEEVR